MLLRKSLNYILFNDKYPEHNFVEHHTTQWKGDLKEQKIECKTS
jgi:hypothetical protein